MSPGKTLHSHICIVDADGKSEHVVYSAPEHFGAPNGSPDGGYLCSTAREVCGVCRSPRAYVPDKNPTTV